MNTRLDEFETDEELYEALNVALVVGGSIVIPHLRHAFETLDFLRDRENGQGDIT